MILYAVIMVVYYCLLLCLFKYYLLAARGTLKRDSRLPAAGTPAKAIFMYVSTRHSAPICMPNF